MKKRNLIEIISIFSLFIILVVLMILVPNMNTNINTGKLIINEVMLVNNNTIKDKDDKYSDYIELYNGNDYDVNLYGYYLTDNMKETKKWSFPDITIKANDYLVIFASGKNLLGDELHTNFKLDSKGETIALSNASAKVISKVYVKETLKDTSYGYNTKEKDYVYYYLGTPGKENTGEYTKDPIYEIKNDYKLKITEYMTNNLSYKKSFDDKFYSLIEIHNEDDKDINLKGFYLSDKEDNITKYTFPDVTIKKDEYLIVYASGYNKIEKGEVHTNFKLNNKDGVLLLSSPLKAIIDKVELEKLDGNTSYGVYKNKWNIYGMPSFGKENTKDYGKNNIKKDVIINEVSIYPKEAIELYNTTDEDIKLTDYSLSDKSGVSYNLDKYTIKSDGYLVLTDSTLGFNINNTNEVIYLSNNGQIIDTFEVSKLVGNISTGITDGKKVYYKTITLGSKNSSTIYTGFSEVPSFNTTNAYVKKGDTITLSTKDNSEIYYTTNGSFPTKNSTKYTKPIEINKNTVIKAISYKDGLIESDAVSRTYLIERKHTISVVSVTTNNMSFYQAYTGNPQEVKGNFEFYDVNGDFGTSFTAGVKVSGRSSSLLPQKSISIYLRKRYGLNNINYPFFDTTSYHNYSSIQLRNGGTDPTRLHIKDAILSRILEGEMDIDLLAYKPVAVYVNGRYYGMYSLREKSNADYIESKHGVKKENIDLIKKKLVVRGSKKDYNELMSYIKNHDVTKSEVYEYIKNKVDVQELINYYIAESFFSNSDLFARNVGLWKAKNGKWRWMFYDLDYAYVDYEAKANLFVNQKPYYNSSLDMVIKLYNNKEFKDLYLKSLAKYLKTTFKPSRTSKIVDELSKEIENEMKYHINRWSGYSYPYNWDNVTSLSSWKSNLNSLKSSMKNRYYSIVNNLKNGFKLSNDEYNKYFSDI